METVVVTKRVRGRSKSGGGGKKISGNLHKCARYLLENRLEKNKIRRRLKRERMIARGKEKKLRKVLIN